MSNKSIKLVNMTSTEMFKLQVESTFGKFRYDNNPQDPSISFIPTHLGGILNQRDLVDSRSVMRQITVTQK